MAKMEEKHCGMGGTCGMLSGLVVLLSGASFAAGAMGMFNGGTLVGGVLLALYGVSKMAHKMGWCSVCKC